MSNASSPLALSIAVSGMHCAACVGHVEKALLAVPGVTSASVNLAAERADVLIDDPSALIAIAPAIVEAGYEIPGETTSFAIEGMHCAACTGHIERVVAALPGVSAVAVNLATGRAEVKHLAGLPGIAVIEAAIADAGYPAHAVMPEGAAKPAAERRTREEALLARDIAIAAALAIPLLVLEMGGHLVPAFHHWLHDQIAPETLRWVQAALATGVVFGPGFRFHRVGLPGLIARRPDMNALISLGTLAAWAYSIAVTVAPQAFPVANRAIYFESAAVVILFVLVGRWLEQRSRGAAGQAIERLVALAPAEARIRRDDGFVLASTAEIVAGDQIELRPGDRVPVDGIIIEGRSHIDESMLTGEPMPVEKGPSQGVTGGTIVQDGRLIVTATRVGRDATLQRIIRLVEQAQAGKLPIQSRIDGVTAIFVPAVLAMAGLTFILWMVFAPEPAFQTALIHAVAVLIIACPCAMGLATPMSILVGTGRAAELGLLFRDGAALQRLAEVDRVAFDKTGTLTLGKPTLTDFIVADGFDRSDVLAKIAAIEAQSEHPIARAVVSFAKEAGLALPAATETRAEIGQGFSGFAEGAEIRVGNAHWLGSQGIALDALLPAAESLGAEGKGPIFAAIGPKVAAVMAIADPLRPDAPALITALADMSVTTMLISGDATPAVKRVADGLGISEAIGEATPQRKADIVRARIVGGESLAFVGDGINDAAALGAADIGIAIGSGTEVAVESADVVLVSRRLMAIADAIGLARATMRNITQNLFWAFGYNIVLIPVAAGALHPLFGISLSPALAAAAMALSSLFVVLNALRLGGYRRSA